MVKGRKIFKTLEFSPGHLVLPPGHLVLLPSQLVLPTGQLVLPPGQLVLFPPSLELLENDFLKFAIFNFVIFASLYFVIGGFHGKIR